MRVKADQNEGNNAQSSYLCILNMEKQKLI